MNALLFCIILQWAIPVESVLPSLSNVHILECQFANDIHGMTLSLQWLPTACYALLHPISSNVTAIDVCYLPKSFQNDFNITKYTWHIHGLWPYSNVVQTEFCLYPEIEQNKIVMLQNMESINDKWVNIAGRNLQLWMAQWNKHGSCLMRTYDNGFIDYFKLTLTLKDAYNPTEAFQEKNIIPGASYTYEQFYNAILDKFKKNVHLTCFWDTTKTFVYLHEVRFCFYLQSHKLKNCSPDTKYANKCPENECIYYPSILPQKIDTFNEYTSNTSENTTSERVQNVGTQSNMDNYHSSPGPSTRHNSRPQQNRHQSKYLSHHRSTLPNENSKTENIDNPRETENFRYYVFVQKLPLANCYENVKNENGLLHECLMKLSNPIWLPRGVWLSRYRYLDQDECQNNANTEAAKYTNLNKNGLVNGRCIKETDYNALKLYVELQPNLSKKYNMTGIFVKNNIVPGKNYKLYEYQNAVKAIFRQIPEFRCVLNEETKKEYLYEVRLCLSTDFSLISCSKMGNCPLLKEIFYQ